MKRRYRALTVLLVLTFLCSAITSYAAPLQLEGENAAGERSLYEVAVGFVRYGELEGRSTIMASSNTTPELMWAEIMLQKLTGTDPTNDAHWTNQWMTPEYRYDNSGYGSLVSVDYFDVIIGGTYRTKVTFYENNGGIITSIGPVYSQAAGL